VHHDSYVRFLMSTKALPSQYPIAMDNGSSVTALGQGKQSVQNPPFLKARLKTVYSQANSC